MKKKILILSICLCTLLTGCGKSAKLKNGEEIVAKLEGKKITANDLYEQLKNQGGEKILLQMVDAYIISQEVKDNSEAKEYAKNYLSQLKSYYEKAGQDFASVLSSYGFANETELLNNLINDYQKQEVAKKYITKELTDDEINAYYKKEIFGEQTVRHILIKPETKDDMTDDEITEAEANALKEAKKIIKKLKNGEDFETLAKKYSDDEGTKEDGGLFADFTKEGVDADFWEASYKLEDGKYTDEPIKSAYGYHVILKVSSKEKPTLDEVVDDIKDTLVQEKIANDSNIVTKTWIKIRESYNLKINDSNIKKAYKESTK